MAGNGAIRVRNPADIFISWLHPVGSIINAIGGLQFADIAQYPIDLLFRDLPLWRHITKRPMMLRRALPGGAMEGGIAVVAGIVNVVDQGRAFFGTGGILAVALCAIFVEDDFSGEGCLGKFRDDKFAGRFHG